MSGDFKGEHKQANEKITIQVTDCGMQPDFLDAGLEQQHQRLQQAYTLDEQVWDRMRDKQDLQARELAVEALRLYPG